MCLTNWDWRVLGAKLTHVVLLIQNISDAFRKSFGMKCEGEFRYLNGANAYTSCVDKGPSSMRGKMRFRLAVPESNMIDLEKVKESYV